MIHTPTPQAAEHTTANMFAPGTTAYFHILLLAERYPDLTPTELRVCVLVKRMLTSTAIGAILGISPTTVDNHRCNSRRKMGLSHNDNLETHLMRI